MLNDMETGPEPLSLKDDATLANSGIVANSRMNRERGVVGPNSYAKDLGFNPLEYLQDRLRTEDQVSWLDLCCGTGNALIQSAVFFEDAGPGSRVQILGIDLVPMFYQHPSSLACLRLEEASLSEWSTEESFDLITCVHGLHYIGDKLGLLRRAASWLKVTGILLAHLDYANLRLESGKSSTTIGKSLKRAGFEYRSKKRVLVCRGRRRFTLPYQYLGADDTAGPNYTGQPAVNSYYRG